MPSQLFKATLVPCIFFCGIANLLGAEPEETLAGHSYHGDAFNEGPRQKAYLIAGTGNVSFPATTKSKEAQKFLDQGIGQLHGFWYFESERSFRQAAMLDPDCAIAYWGMAMANINNSKRARGFISKAIEHKKGITERETMYIDALAAYLKADVGKDKKKKTSRNKKYAKAYEKIIYKYPDDIEAKAFLGVQLWVNRKDESIDSHLAVSLLIGQILKVNPMHPCHHYLIHLWDHEKPEMALPNAARCGQAAPAIAHMWHMPGHIYSRLKRYDDAVWQQEASARVDHAHMIRDRVMPDQIHNFAHNNEWLTRNLIHVGRMHDAIDLSKNMLSMPRHPKYNTLKKKGSSHYGRLRLYETLIRFELWDEMIALTETAYLEPTDLYSEQVKRIRYLGRAYFKKGETEKANAQLALLETMLEDEKSEESPSNKLPAKEQDARLRDLNNAIKELKGRAAIAEGDHEKGFEQLKKAGHVVQTNLAQLYLSVGKTDEAEKAIRGYLKTHKNEVLTLAHLVEVLWKSDKPEAAAESFKQLQELAGQADLDAPVLQRLTPLAEKLGLSRDWRTPQPPAKDLGTRPALDTLGPFRWRPYQAPAFALKDVKGKEFTLKNYAGKPLIVIFYLGYGCLHCAEQLQAFAPQAEAFQKAGIELIAVSTDNQEELQKSHDNYKDGDFPFPLVSNSDLDVFKNFRCFDDFEKQTLHGTFLIDATGMVRWQDISYEPFMDPDFVLKESRRLLAQKITFETSLPKTETVAFLDDETTAEKERPFQPGKHTKDSLEKVKKLLKGNKAILLDVREKREWNSGHLKQALLVPLSELKKHGGKKEYAKNLGKKISKKKIVYCHCRSGGRALPAAKVLFDLGYDIRPLKTGYYDLLDHGFLKAK